MIDARAVSAIDDPALAGRWLLLIEGTTSAYQCVAEQVEAPFVEIGNKTRYAGGYQFNYPDNASLSQLNVTFFETYKYEVTRFLRDWRSKIMRPDHTFGLPVDYKRTISCNLYLPTANTPVLELKYSGCWPGTRGSFALSYDEVDGRLQVNATFTVDRLVENFS